MLGLIVRGYSNKEIARELDLAVGTVKVHVAALFAKLGVHCRAGAVATLIRTPGIAAALAPAVLYAPEARANDWSRPCTN